MRGTTPKGGDLYRVVAMGLVVVMAVYSTPVARVAGAAHADLAEIRGAVLASDGLTGVAGASVKAAHLESKRIYTSQATAADGRYSLSGLPGGSYDLAVETPQGLYVADVLVEAVPGRRSLVSLALKPQGQEGEQGEEEKKPEEPKAEEGKKEGQGQGQAEPEEQKKKKKGGGFWRSPGGAAIAIVVGAGLLGAAANSAADDEEEPPMTPN